jgi:prephenate dehydrogenase
MTPVPTSTDAARRAATLELPARVAFLGFGLIGGSIARALRDIGVPSRLVAWTPDGRGPAAGVAADIIDEAAATPAKALEGSRLVILAGPPLAVLAAVSDRAGPLRASLASQATITDVASTKSRIVAAASAAALPFVGGHPMAGRDASGFEASSSELFIDRPWVIVRSTWASDRDVSRVEALAEAVGAHPMSMGPEEHDRAVAAISHLPLVLAASLVEAVLGPGRDADGARSLAATGWADMTRLARGDAEMGAGILATNAPAIVERLHEVRSAIDAWIEALDRVDVAKDAKPLRTRLEAARAALDHGRPG